MNFLAGIICEFLAKIIMFVCRKRLLPFDKIIIKSLSLLTHCKLEQFDTITTCFVTIFAVLKATLELLISISQSISFESNTLFKNQQKISPQAITTFVLFGLVINNSKPVMGVFGTSFYCKHLLLLSLSLLHLSF